MAEDEIDNAKPDQNNPAAYLLLHIFLGPIIGFLFVCAVAIGKSVPGLLGSFQFNPHALGEVSFVLLGLVMLSWGFGFVPAIVHAALMLVLHRLIGRSLVWIMLTPVIGWVVIFVPMLLIGGDRRIFTDGAYMALVGSAAAVGCLAIAWWRRIYPVRS